MYIPELQEMTRQFSKDCSDASSLKATLPSTLNNWVRIALDGQVTVYAHIWDSEEEEIVA
jgi:hypothetical protein